MAKDYLNSVQPTKCKHLCGVVPVGKQNLVKKVGSEFLPRFKSSPGKEICAQSLQRAVQTAGGQMRFESP